MKSLNDSEKEAMIILIALAVCSINIWFIAALASIRTTNTPPKKYDEECVVNYIKYPLKECIYKEKHD